MKISETLFDKFQWNFFELWFYIYTILLITVSAGDILKEKSLLLLEQTVSFKTFIWYVIIHWFFNCFYTYVLWYWY